MDFIHEAIGEFVPSFQIFNVGLGGDDKTGGHRQPDLGHGAESRPFSSQELLILAVAFFKGIAITVFGYLRCLFSHIAPLLILIELPIFPVLLTWM